MTDLLVTPKKRATKPKAAKTTARSCKPLQEITVVYPEQSFAPVPYNTFKVGGIFYKTFVKPEETEEEAYERAWNFVSELARKQFTSVRKDFFERYEGKAL